MNTDNFANRQMAADIAGEVPVIQVKKIDRILKRDAKNMRLIVGHLAQGKNNVKSTCTSVGRCAIGALLIAAGFPLKRLMNENGVREGYSGSPAAKLLEREYGLLTQHVYPIENTNDGACAISPKEDQARRYDAVMGLVLFLDVMQANGIRFDSADAVSTAYNDAKFDQQ